MAAWEDIPRSSIIQAWINKRTRYLVLSAAVIFLSILLLSSTSSGRDLTGLSTSSGFLDAWPDHLTNIGNSTLGFEKILAINLPERTDHHDGLVLASSVTGLKIDYVDGVGSDSIKEKTLPPNHSNNVRPSVVAAWRAHINALSKVVEEGWQSALIVEDDVDWDVRLKQQMKEFALASNHVLSASSPGQISFSQIKDVVHVGSPYGEGWDVLWLGHCGMQLPPQEASSRVVIENDGTVAATRFQRSWDEKASSPLEDYPQHSRIVTTVEEGTCSLAYAVSHQGARKLLLQLGLRRMTEAFDLMLRQWCQGTNGFEKGARCISVLPQLFDHHRRVGPNEIDSDISIPNDKYREKAYTLNIRYSVRLNMDKILAGQTDYDDQWPDSL